MVDAAKAVEIEWSISIFASDAHSWVELIHVSLQLLLEICGRDNEDRMQFTHALYFYIYSFLQTVEDTFRKLSDIVRRDLLLSTTRIWNRSIVRYC
jgi:hypothetical protein